MPQKKISPEPPVMSWGRAAPFVVGAFVFDLIRGFFQFFWFFGPALGAVVCTAGVNAVVGASIADVAGKVVATGCSAAAVVLGTTFSETTAVFGVIVADALGLFAFLTIKMWMYSSSRRRRVLKETWLWHMGSLMGSIIPFIGAFPFYSFVLFFTYKHQIKIEKADYKKWEKETAAARLQERNQQSSQFMQTQAAGQMQFAQQEAANDAVYAQAANDERYTNEEIPEEVRKAA